MRVVVRCDVGPARGVGHLMRGVALAEEVIGRGGEVVFACDSHTVPWAHAQLVKRGIAVEPAVWSAEGHVELVRRLRVDAVVFDSYDLDTDVYAAVRSTGVPTLAIVDGDFRGAQADLLVDQNLAAEQDRPDLPPGTTRLAGLEYVLFRNDILEHRPSAPPTPTRSPVPTVFAFFGGTDAFGAGPTVVRSLAATGVPFKARVVAPTAPLAAAINAVELEPGQQVEVIPPTDRLAEEVTAADLAISASGTSTWELLCLGAPTALTCVVDNQVMGYERAIATRAAAGIGLLSNLRNDLTAAAPTLKRLLTDPADRTRLSHTAWHLLDGHGRARVFDALNQLVRRHRGT